MMDDLQREMERYLSHFSRAGKRPTIVFSQHGHTGPVWTPAVDQYETADAVIIVLEMAGVDPSRTSIEAEAGRIRISGVRQVRHHVQPDERRSYHALEIAYGPFERSLALPAGLETDAAKASYKDGLLEVTIPKKAPTQVRINVDAG
jgi:HSP20 family protein